MIEIRIGDSTRDLQSLEESWITEQINRRRAAGEPVCVQVIFRTPELNMALSSSGCAGSGGGGRPPNAQEKSIMDLWGKNHMDSSDFAGGNLVAFLKQLKRQI